MSAEITRYDHFAQYIYTLHKGEGWPAFYNMKRKDRDYWRAIAQTIIDGGYQDSFTGYVPPANDDGPYNPLQKVAATV